MRLITQLTADEIRRYGMAEPGPIDPDEPETFREVRRYVDAEGDLHILSEGSKGTSQAEILTSARRR